jgi:hypothetical protein
MDHEGNIIRNPNEILHAWTYEQVLDALELKLIREKTLAAARANAKQRR